MKHLILSHYDLDGIGCVINIYNTIKNKENFQYHLVGYTTLDDKFRKMEKDEADVLWITDLNLRQENIAAIAELALKLDLKKIILVDHHVYEYDLRAEIEKYGKDFSDKFTTVIDRSACATATLYRLFKSANEHVSHLKELSEIINVYDTWMKTSKYWNDAYALNDLFWEYKYQTFFAKFKDGYFPTEEDIEVSNIIRTERDEYVKYTIDNYFVGSEEERTVFILNPDCKYTNHFTLVFRDVNNYVILKECRPESFSYSIRLYNDELDLTIQTLFDKIKQMGVDVITSGGHDKVGAITIGYDDNENFLETISKIFTKEIE